MPQKITRRRMLTRTGLAAAGLAFPGVLMFPSTGKPEVVEHAGGLKTADIVIGCVDSRLRGKPLADAYQSENLKPFFIKVPGATATPAVLNKVQALVRKVMREHGKNVQFRVHVVGHGSLDLKAEQIPGGGYLNYELSKDPKRAQCGMKGGGGYLQEVLAEMLREGHQGKLWDGNKYIKIESEGELRRLIRDYFHLNERSLFDFLHDIPPVHHHVMQQVEDAEIELRDRLPGARLQFFGAVEDHGNEKTGKAYQLYTIHASGSHATEDREVKFDDNPLLAAYNKAQQTFSKMSPAEQKLEMSRRTEAQHPQYHVIIDSAVESSLSSILRKNLNMEPEAGKFFTTVFDPENPDPLAVSSHGYWLDHILSHAPAEVKKKATVIFVGPDPKKLEDALEKTPLGKHFLDKNGKLISETLHIKAE